MHSMFDGDVYRDSDNIHGSSTKSILSEDKTLRTRGSKVWIRAGVAAFLALKY